jgi:hypothetical protein
MLPRSVATRLALASLALAGFARAQEPTPPADAVRVTVSMNADGSTTVYEFDSPHHKATATTTAKSGELIGKIRYVLDDAGRFSSGEVYGPDDQFRFRTLYNYDSAGKILQETQLGKDDAVRNKIVYAYDKMGRQIGYTVFDAAGKVIRSMPEKSSPKPTPSSRRTR